MISPGAKRFAKFATRATPKNSFRAFSCKPSQSGFTIGNKIPSVSSFAARLAPIPPAMSNVGTGLGVPATAFTRSMSVIAGKASSVDELEDSLSARESSNGLTVEASEDLEVILSKMRTDSSRNVEVGGMTCHTTIIIDFFASWCGPCKVLTPLLQEEVAASKSAVLVKVNVDEAPKIAEKYQISSLPTVKAFRGGKEISSFTGARNRNFIKSFIAELEQ